MGEVLQYDALTISYLCAKYNTYLCGIVHLDSNTFGCEFSLGVELPLELQGAVECGDEGSELGDGVVW